MRKKILFGLFIFITSFLFAGNPGTTSANFLKIGVGARPAGMGNAFTAVADDVNSIYWNPAGLLCLKNNEFIFMHSTWFEDIQYEYAGYSHTLKNTVLGFGFSYVNLGDIDVTKIDGTDPVTGLGTTSAKDALFICSIAREIINDLKTGINFKYIKEKIDDQSANAFAVDIGGQFSLIDNVVQVGFVLQNYGTNVTFIHQDYSLPSTFKIGSAITLNSYNTTISLDLVKPKDNNIIINCGTEYVLQKFSIRLGYSSLNEAGSGITAGAGFKYSSFKFDYAFVPYGDLGNTHRFSFNYIFN